MEMELTTEPGETVTIHPNPVKPKRKVKRKTKAFKQPKAEPKAEPKGKKGPKTYEYKKQPKGYKWNPKNIKVATAEEWYRGVVDEFRPMFKHTGYTVPDFDISSGFTNAGTRDTQVLGQCWSPGLSDKGRPHIFLNPRNTEPVLLTLTVLHEVIHATVGNEHHHRGEFARVALEMGFLHPLTHLKVDERLNEAAKGVAGRLGEFPRSAWGGRFKRQSTRLIKCECNKCKSIFRASKSVIRAAGRLHCIRAECAGRVAAWIQDEDEDEGGDE